MEWIQTYTGKKFFPLAPRVQDIDIVDIAHALSMNCRFNGHCLRYYCVAEHSVRVSHAVSDANALWGLLHDAAEAYLTDVPRPVKHQVKHFGEIEDRLLRVIIEHFDMAWPMPEEVRLADDTLLMTEQRDLMAPPPDAWSIVAKPLPEKITPMTAEQAEKAYLDRFAHLRKAQRST